MIKLARISDSFTRPTGTDQYTAGDLIANSVTAGSVVPLKFAIPIGNGKGLKIREVRIVKSGTTITDASFTVHFYGSPPTPANGDNGAYSTNVADYMGFLPGGQMVAFTDGGVAVNAVGDAGAPADCVICSQGYVYGLMEADDTYTPASAETFTVTITIEQYPF